ncbi:LysR family transcriptional regulator [Hoeflea prorocentri]|uniref:LysR family transcriptional regulator n=1 Tax=Hoeflea prorocentri TaxID=1922333 RepID=A0A9X3UKJ1_9HYPH|nr:LysR family transcriptional regulator [Hoeflea prorocentri]MCY6382100.1 LysR family transcriptional regulator [Hoeflea prorocentri]MDA5399900.1 LysR family transcriptional regulator [Hoeflea prorocentri]
MGMDIDALKAFLAIIETGSFTAAGQQIGRTQSAVSQQIKKLEAEIGRPILERGSGTVRLTQEGRRLLGPAREVLNAHDRACEAFALTSSAGRVALGMSEVFLTPVLRRLLPEMRKVAPYVELSLWTEATPDLIGGLRDSGLDLALLAGAAAGMPQTVPLFVRNPVWIGPEVVDLHEQDPLPIIIWVEGSDYARTIRGALERAGRRYRVAMSTKSFGGMMAAARAGIGIAAGLEENVDAGLRVLGRDAGMPPLPALKVSLARRPEARSKVVRDVERLIVDLCADGTT